MPETKVLRFKEGRYEGEVNKAGDPEGEGTLEYPGNDEFLRQIYEGQFVNKKAHGKGTMRWNQGDKYEGDWKDGLRHGKGEYWSKVSCFDYYTVVMFLMQIQRLINLLFSRQMDSNTLVITKMIKSMGGENTHTQMETSIMVIGKMA